MSASSSSARQLLILLLVILAFLLKECFFAFGYYFNTRLGPTLDLFEKNQGWRSFNQIFYAKKTKIITVFGKERVVPRILSFLLVFESYQSPLPPYFLSFSHRFCIR